MYVTCKYVKKKNLSWKTVSGMISLQTSFLWISLQCTWCVFTQIPIYAFMFHANGKINDEVQTYISVYDSILWKIFLYKEIFSRELYPFDAFIILKISNSFTHEIDFF